MALRPGSILTDPYGPRLPLAAERIETRPPPAEAGPGFVDRTGTKSVRAAGSIEPPRRASQSPPSCDARPSAPAPVPSTSASEYARTSCAGRAKATPAGESVYAEPIAFGASLAMGAMERVVAAARAPSGTLRVKRPSA